MSSRVRMRIRCFICVVFNVSSTKSNLPVNLVISENCCTFIVLNYKVAQTIIAMFTEDKVTEIFFMADEFYKVFAVCWTNIVSILPK